MAILGTTGNRYRTSNTPATSAQPLVLLPTSIRPLPLFENRRELVMTALTQADGESLGSKDAGIVDNVID